MNDIDFRTFLRIERARRNQNLLEFAGTIGIPRHRLEHWLYIKVPSELVQEAVRARLLQKAG